jgi:hypothetical protein
MARLCRSRRRKFRQARHRVRFSQTSRSLASPASILRWRSCQRRTRRHARRARRCICQRPVQWLPPTPRAPRQRRAYRRWAADRRTHAVAQNADAYARTPVPDLIGDDPGIHPSSQRSLSKKMDHRVKCLVRRHGRHLFADMTDTFAARPSRGMTCQCGVAEPGLQRAHRGARLARIRCRVRRCMFSRRAVSETLRLHIS